MCIRSFWMDRPCNVAKLAQTLASVAFAQLEENRLSACGNHVIFTKLLSESELKTLENMTIYGQQTGKLY